jgi:hypothetical protein
MKSVQWREEEEEEKRASEMAIEKCFSCYISFHSIGFELKGQRNEEKFTSKRKLILLN